jgi:hypothetical protein
MMLSMAVLATWTVVLAWCVLVGGFAGVIAGRRVGVLGGLRVAMWFGFAFIVLALLVLNLFVPLKGGSALACLAGVTVIAVIALVWTWLTGRDSGAERPRRNAGLITTWWAAVPIAALTLTLVYFAHSFAGPLTNIDSGSYHLNAIQFSAAYPTIPGLANFQDRLGTNVSAFNVAAFLANTPWGIEAFRLLVGLFVALFAADVVLRLVDRESTARRAPGTIVLLLAMTIAGPFLFDDPTHWITSPTPDTIAMLLVFVSGAYLLDAFMASSSRAVWSSTAVVGATLAASVRTQLWVFACLVVFAFVARWWLNRRMLDRPAGSRVLTWLSGSIFGAIFAVMMVRDAILSGWLLFPLGLLPIPVEWRVTDPEASRVWITSWARDPQGTPESTTGNWDWLGAWSARVLDDWAVRGAVGALALFVLLTLLRHARPVDGGPRERGLSRWDWALVLLPVVATLLVWFVAAPDPRFAWGVIGLAGVIPAAVALTCAGIDLVVPLVAGFATLALLPTAFASVAQIRGFIAEGAELLTYTFGPISVAAYVNPVPSDPLQAFELNSGRTIVTPIDSQNCWMSFPLCRPYPDPLMRFRGDDVSDGFITPMS